MKRVFFCLPAALSFAAPVRNFDVYFDYSRSMMYLLPNERYRQRWGS